MGNSINSLAPKNYNFRRVIFKQILVKVVTWSNCPNMNVTWLHWLSVNIGSGNGLVSSDNTPLPEPMLTKISVTMWRHLTTISFRCFIAVWPIEYELCLFCYIHNMPLSFMRSIDQLWRRTSEKSLTITQAAHWHIYATLGEMTWDNSKIVLVQIYIQVRQITDNIKQLHGTSSWFVNVFHTRWNQVPDIAYPYLNAN